VSGTVGTDAKRFIRIIFLAYFLVYAVSPLSRPINVQHAHESYSSGCTGLTAGNLHIFVWEVIFSKFVSETTADSTPGDPVVRVLLKKVRAILPEDISVKIISPEKTAVFEGPVLLPAPASSDCRVKEESLPVVNCIYSLYSGHSPPLLNVPPV